MTSCQINLNLYLKHFNEPLIHTILTETGYSSLIDYEMSCRASDIFPVHFQFNGMMTCEYPSLDPSIWRVFEFSLHHLTFEARTLILEKYIGMSLIDYETQYPEYNNIYVYVPYKNVSNIYCTDYQYNQDLSGWNFRLNKRTGKSYLLYKTQKVLGIYDGNVYYDDGSIVDAIWNLSMIGLEHPLYYNKKSKGFLIGVRFREQLLNYGAVYTDETDVMVFEKEEPLRGWNYWVNPKTFNSFCLAPSNLEFRKVKNGYAYFGNEKFSTKLTPRGMILSKPFYFCKFHQAWIVSYNLEERLLDFGANLREFEQSQEQQTMPLCERFSKQEKKLEQTQKKLTVISQPIDKQEKKSSVKVVAENKQLLTGMKFTLNSKTLNSFILTPEVDKMISLDDVNVYFGSMKFKKQITYDVMGEEKTFYYNDTYKGWIISLKYKQWLLENGAKLI